jgi:tetratricopeptide (TPR) repeat protein
MKKVLFLFSLLILLSGCAEDPLRILPPDGQVKEEYWKKKEDVKATLISAYYKFAQMDGSLFYYGELRGDLLQEDVNLDNELRDVMNSTIEPDNSLADWQAFYSVINYCNLVLKYSPHVKKVDPNFADYQYKAYRGEAIFLRSLAYFYLVRIFKDVPLILKPYDSDKQNFFPSKTSGEVILDSLEVQLSRSLNIIPVDYQTNAKTRGRATQGAVNALLADIALWKYDYQACVNYVENIEQSELYELVNGGEWFDIFAEGNTLEGIFEIQFDSRIGQNNSLYQITRPQRNNFLASTYTLDILSPETTKEIVRGNGTIKYKDKTIWKYIGQKPDGLTERSGADQQSCNWIVYRMAGVLLMKAEALSQIGRYEEALNIVNKIRIRAFKSPIASYQQNAQAFEDLILKERAKELAYEGKRWFDLLRMGRRNNYKRKGKLIELIIDNVPATQKRVLASKLNDVNGWYFPILDTEIENNPNLVQNPYYQVLED